MTDEEMKQRAQKWIEANPTIGYDWNRGMCDQVLAAFAASIQAERQLKFDAAMNEEYVKMEQQLAEARAQAFKEAAEIALNTDVYTTTGWMHASHARGLIAAAIERAAEAQKPQEKTLDIR